MRRFAKVSAVALAVAVGACTASESGDAAPQATEVPTSSAAQASSVATPATGSGIPGTTKARFIPPSTDEPYGFWVGTELPGYLVGFAAHDGDVAAVLAEHRLSTQGPITEIGVFDAELVWTPIHSGDALPAIEAHWSDVASDGTSLVIAGQSNGAPIVAVVGPDDTEVIELPLDGTIGAVAHANGTWIALGQDGAVSTQDPAPAVLTSADGITWERAALGDEFRRFQPEFVAHGNGVFVVSGSYWDPDSASVEVLGLMRSTDARAWTLETIELDRGLNRVGGQQTVIFDGAEFQLLGLAPDQGSRRAWRSPNGVTWQPAVDIATPSIQYPLAVGAAGSPVIFGDLPGAEHLGSLWVWDSAQWNVLPLSDQLVALDGRRTDTIAVGGRPMLGQEERVWMWMEPLPMPPVDE